jgi:methanethiol S-methyltransferase
METLLLVVACLLWGVIHSWTASHGFKNALTARLGALAMRGYRLAYNIFSVMTIIPILLLMLILPDQPLFRVPEPWTYILLAGQALALIGLMVSLFQTDIWRFSGLDALRPAPTQEPEKLIISGWYARMRHPLYTFGLLFIWLSQSMSLNQFIVYLSLSAYIIIGAFFEERKLLRDFGEAYATYKATTPMFIPRFW